MFVIDSLDVNADGHLTMGGADTIALAKEYGTPLYVLNEDAIREHCRSFKDSIERFYNGKGLVCYASKAFCCTAMCKLIKSEGLGLDVVSGGELYTAINAGFQMENVCFHGNNKESDELILAISHGVGRIVVDNFSELERLNALAVKLGKTVGIMFRIKPGVEAHTHSFIQTGQIDSKFGFALETGEAFTAVKTALSLPNLKLVGLHCHIGSQIMDVAPFELAAKVMLEFMAKIRDELSYTVLELNLGGGFGVRYVENDAEVPFENYMECVSKTVKSTCETLGMEAPFIIIEPGRAIVASAGLTLYTVGGVKKIPNVRTYVTVDGGMTDNPRYCLYGAEYTAEVANKAGLKKSLTVTLAGKCCESGDLLGENIPLQQVEQGDILAILCTGAYNYSMASNYNRTPRPPVVMLKGGNSKLIVKRETLEDIIRNDL